MAAQIAQKWPETSLNFSCCEQHLWGSQPLKQIKVGRSWTGVVKNRYKKW